MLRIKSPEWPQDLQIILQIKMQTSIIKKRLHSTSLLHSVENRVRPDQFYVKCQMLKTLVMSTARETKPSRDLFINVAKNQPGLDSFTDKHCYFCVMNKTKVLLHPAGIQLR